VSEAYYKQYSEIQYSYNLLVLYVASMMTLLVAWLFETHFFVYWDCMFCLLTVKYTTTHTCTIYKIYINIKSSITICLTLTLLPLSVLTSLLLSKNNDKQSKVIQQRQTHTNWWN